MIERDGTSAKRHAVIVLTSVPSYIPDGIELRMQISDYIFTADVDANDLDRLKADPNIVKVGGAIALPGYAPVSRGGKL